MWAALFLLPLICLQAVLLPADEFFHDGHAQGAELGADDGLGTTGLELPGHNAQVNGIACNVLAPGGGSLAGELAGLLTAGDAVQGFPACRLPKYGLKAARRASQFSRL